MDDKVSNRNIYGCYENSEDDEEVVISVKNGVLTIVHQSMKNLSSKVQVIVHCDLAIMTDDIKTSYTVEKSSILDEDVYKGRVKKRKKK